MRELPPIEEGFDVFVHDGDVKIGAVRDVRPHSITIFVENAGDFSVPKDAVHEVVAGKVVLHCGLLDSGLKNAINHAHDAEDPKAMSGFPQDPVD
ncbi:hypothetical protein FHS83_001103 [Rhizomicrobium palustre]|jgi:hypothetical protein|uniref:DUF2171 domain-containing protein n=1 Tax=Rhizomicrobium palustre TaxID=189966 RepID=A0A846MX33_9PROT|nr:hypothetical protein [Rhizomicrobium palustre]NIK87785.1 hypothetical protein [Rhizomicrobium palustre]